MGMKARPKRHELVHVAGVEGTGIYLNSIRIAGPKPWGGGKIVHRCTVSDDDIQRALKEAG